MKYSEMKKKELLDEINKLKNEVNRLEQYKRYEDAANDLKAMHDSLINAGFTNEQAFTLIIQMIPNAAKMVR